MLTASVATAMSLIHARLAPGANAIKGRLQTSLGEVIGCRPALQFWRYGSL